MVRKLADPRVLVGMQRHEGEERSKPATRPLQPVEPGVSVFPVFRALASRVANGQAARVAKEAPGQMNFVEVC